MKYNGATFGIIPDTFNTILNNYLVPLQNTFPNSTDISSPVYAMAFVSATQDQILESALQSLWNAINANTAQGLGLDILASTVLNLTRKPLNPSSCSIKVTIGPIYSTCQIQMTVTSVSGSPSIPTGWTATGPSTLSPYTYLGAAIPITATGVYYFIVSSTDTTTSVPASAFTGGSSIAGVSFTITNLASAVLGSIIIPTTFQVTTGLAGSPIYSPTSPETFITAGVYNFIVYSQDITTLIGADQLNTASDSTGTASYLSYITDVTNPYNAVLGTPIETDAQFAARRRYYLNVQGQTYYGMEKAILNLNVPALQSLFIAETLNDLTSYSILIVKITVSVASGPVTIPSGWHVFGSASPSPNYSTQSTYVFTSNGTYYIPTFSTDTTTAIGIGTISTADAPYPTGVTAVTNLDPAILGTTVSPNGLGERGYTVYLEYPSIAPFSIVTMTLTVSAVTGTVTIPVGWAATGFSTNVPYTTQQTYTISTPGTYNITCYSTDWATVVPANSFTGGTAVAGLTFTATNPSAAILGGNFDTNDLYLQQIAQTCYAYHPLGTQFYAAAAGATTFIVPTPFPGYSYSLILNPFQISYVTCNLLLVYNADPTDAGFSNGVFDVTLLPNLKTEILELINDYFLSKTLPTDLVYTITELSEILQAAYTGIVALVGNSSTIFSFGTVSPSTSGHVFLRRLIGYNFLLTNANFNFAYINKDVF